MYGCLQPAPLLDAELADCLSPGASPRARPLDNACPRTETSELADCLSPGASPRALVDFPEPLSPGGFLEANCSNGYSAGESGWLHSVDTFGFSTEYTCGGVSRPDAVGYVWFVVAAADGRSRDALLCQQLRTFLSSGAGECWCLSEDLGHVLNLCAAQDVAEPQSLSLLVEALGTAKTCDHSLSPLLRTLAVAPARYQKLAHSQLVGDVRFDLCALADSALPNASSAAEKDLEWPPLEAIAQQAPARTGRVGAKRAMRPGRCSGE